MFKEYPKVISAGGIKVTVTSAEDEARWLGQDAAAPVEPIVESAPLPEADVEVIHEDDSIETPTRKVTHKGGKKK